MALMAGKWGRLVKILLLVVIIAIVLYFAVPALAAWAKSGTTSSAISALKAPSTFWKTIL